MAVREARAAQRRGPVLALLLVGRLRHSRAFGLWAVRFFLSSLTLSTNMYGVVAVDEQRVTQHNDREFDLTTQVTFPHIRDT